MERPLRSSMVNSSISYTDCTPYIQLHLLHTLSRASYLFDTGLNSLTTPLVIHPDQPSLARLVTDSKDHKMAVSQSLTTPGGIRLRSCYDNTKSMRISSFICYWK